MFLDISSFWINNCFQLSNLSFDTGYNELLIDCTETDLEILPTN